MAYNIKISGVKETIERLNKLERRQVPETLKTALKAASELVLVRMQDNTPVDTGALRDSEEISYDGPYKTLIGPDQTKVPHYAPDVEYGHHTRSGSFVPGQFYVQRTAIETQPEVIEIFVKEFKKLFN